MVDLEEEAYRARCSKNYGIGVLQYPFPYAAAGSLRVRLWRGSLVEGEGVT